MIINTDEWCTIQQARDIFGWPNSMIYRYIEKKLIEKFEFGPKIVILRKSDFVKRLKRGGNNNPTGKQGSRR
jgi:hypothetical protein